MPERTRKGPYPKFDGNTYRRAFFNDQTINPERFAALCRDTARIERALEMARKEVGQVIVSSGWEIVPESGLGLVLSILCELTGKGPWEQ